MNNSFWLENPNILFKSGQLSNIWPMTDMTFENKLNAITRLVIILIIIGYLFTKNNKVILSGLLSLGAIVLLYKMKKDKKIKKEGFTNNQLYNALKPSFTEPTQSNPVMNVLLPEINDNPHRPKAAPSFVPIVENDINNKTKEFIVSNFNDPKIDEKLFKDLGDNFNFEQSMHAWHPMPNTMVANDQKSFAEFCYGDMIACRDEENNEIACVRNMPPRWTNY